MKLKSAASSEGMSFLAAVGLFGGDKLLRLTYLHSIEARCVRRRSSPQSHPRGTCGVCSFISCQPVEVIKFILPYIAKPASAAATTTAKMASQTPAVVMDKYA